MSSPPHPQSLTRSQQQIWVSQRLHADSPLFNMAFVFVFEDELDPDLFRTAWSRAVAVGMTARSVSVSAPARGGGGRTNATANANSMA